MKYKAPKRDKNEPQKTFEIGGGWGDRISWWEWKDRRVTGWKTPRPMVGDILLSKMNSGKIGKFEFIDVEWESDPTDMFWGTVKDIGNEE